jgi:hypothetical protein
VYVASVTLAVACGGRAVTDIAAEIAFILRRVVIDMASTPLPIRIVARRLHVDTGAACSVGPFRLDVDYVRSYGAGE